jgi:farnesol dehydrogenase
MRVFITGATGFIGERLTQHLAESGVQVNALVRNPAKAAGIANTNVVPIRGELSDTESLRRAMEGCEQVYHLAGFLDVWHRDRSIYNRINVEGTRNILKAASDAGVKKLVFTSTAGTMGHSKRGVVNEDTGDISLVTTPYERTKAEAEELVRTWNSHMESVIVNPSRVYGPGQLGRSNIATQLIDWYSRGKWRFVPGTGGQVGNYAFVEDVVRGHLLAMEKGRHGERYILGGENRSYRDFFATIAEVTGRRYRLIGIPLVVMTAFARLQLALAALGKPPSITPGFVRKYNYHWNLDVGKAQRDLGYEITPLKSGIEITLTWLNELQKAGNRKD